VSECGEGQTGTQIAMTTIQFTSSTTRVKFNRIKSVESVMHIVTFVIIVIIINVDV